MYYITNKEIPISDYGADQVLPVGTVLFPFYGATYGCVGAGYAVTLKKDQGPFFEVDRENVNKMN